MSRKSKRHPKVRPAESLTEFKRFGFRSYFLLTLALSLASGLVWYASRGPETTPYLNLGDGIEATLEAVSNSTSPRQLKQLSDEAFELFPTLGPEEKLSAWQVLAAIAVRRQGLAQDEPQRLKAVHDELVARQSIVNLSQKSPSQLLQALSRLEQAARGNLSQTDPAVARQTTSSLILVISLRHAQRPEGTESLKEILALLQSIEGRFIPDASLIQVLEICLEAFSQKQSPKDAEEIAIKLETLLGESSDTALAQWANLIREKQWLRHREIVEQLSLASTGNAAALTKVKDTALDLLQHNPSTKGPSTFGVQRSLELAQFLENLNHPEDAKAIHQTIQSLTTGRSRISVNELEPLKSHSQLALKRISLLGQQVQVPAALLSNAPNRAAVAVVQFVGVTNPSQNLKASLSELARFNDRGSRVFIAGPELGNEGLVAFFGDLSPQITLLSQSEAKKLAEELFVPPSQFLVVIDQGKLALSGAPMDRVQRWLENRLLNPPTETNAR